MPMGDPTLLSDADFDESILSELDESDRDASAQAAVNLDRARDDCDNRDERSSYQGMKICYRGGPAASGAAARKWFRQLLVNSGCMRSYLLLSSTAHRIFLLCNGTSDLMCRSSLRTRYHGVATDITSIPMHIYTFNLINWLRGPNAAGNFAMSTGFADLAKIGILTPYTGQDADVCTIVADPDIFDAD
ncbi:hypothetical protein HDU88_008305 [Geranomyces variabilis]|nr:hypothetical protein HDU88_008305 [Geranomyces variabilis]